MTATGLRHSSPALKANLARLGSRATQDHIEALVTWLQNNAESDYNGILRSKDASFNPRAARIAQIVINETKHHDPDVIAAAILAPLLSELKEPPPTKFKRAFELAESTASLAHRQENPRAEETVVFLAFWLDRLRHAHQLPHMIIGNDEIVLIRKQLEFAQKEISLVRLCTLVSTALARLASPSERAA